MGKTVCENMKTGLFEKNPLGAWEQREIVINSERFEIKDFEKKLVNLRENQRKSTKISEKRPFSTKIGKVTAAQGPRKMRKSHFDPLTCSGAPICMSDPKLVTQTAF